MKRAFILFLLLFSFLVNVSYATDFNPNPTTYSDFIDSYQPPPKNQTFIEVEFYPISGDKYGIYITLYEVTPYAFSVGSEDLTSLEIFNRKLAPDDLNIQYSLGLLHSEPFCIIKNGRCNIDFDASSIEENYFSYGCANIRFIFEGNDVLHPTRSSPITICREKNTLVGEAFASSIEELDASDDDQYICIFFFIFIGFLISGLYAYGMDPLRYFDITTPRLPTSKKKIKFDPNVKPNEVFRGRRDISAIKKRLRKIENKLIFMLKGIATKYYEKEVNKNYKDLSEREKKSKVNTLVSNFISNFEKKLNKLKKGYEKEIDYGLKNVSGRDALRYERDMQLKKENDIKNMFKDNFDNLAYGFEKEKDKIDKKLDDYTKDSINLILAEMSVDYRSLLHRGVAKKGKVSKTRRVIESIPVLGGLSLKLGAIKNFQTLEAKIIKYGYTKAKESISKKTSEKKAQKLFKEIEDVESPNVFSEENITEVEKLKKDKRKETLKSIKENIEPYFSEQKDYPQMSDVDKSRILLYTVQSELSEIDSELNSLRADFNSNLKDYFEKNLDYLKRSERKKIEKMLKLTSDSNLDKLNDKLLKDFEESLKEIDFSDGNEKLKLMNSFRGFASTFLNKEELKENKETLIKFERVSAIRKPDTVEDNVSAMIALENLSNELKDIPNLYLEKRIRENVQSDEEKYELFNLKYGEIIAEHNVVGSERFEKVVELAREFEVEERFISKAETLHSETRELNFREGEDGYLHGAERLIDYSNELLKKENLKELGLIDTFQEKEDKVGRYLRLYSGFNSRVNGKLLKSILKEKGFDAAISEIIKHVGDEDTIRQLHGTDCVYSERMKARTEHNVDKYSEFFAFEKQFKDCLLLLEDKTKKSVLINEFEFESLSPETRRELNELMNFYSERMSQVYDGQKYSEDLFSTTSNGGLDENQINFRDNANEIFSILDKSLSLEIGHKKMLIDLLKKDIETIYPTVKKIKKEAKKDSSIFDEKWVKDSALHRVEAISIVPGLRENLIELKNHTEDKVKTFHNFMDMANQVNNGKRNSSIFINTLCGGVVDIDSNLSGQQIFSKLSYEILGVLGNSYDKYFRSAYVSPRLEFLKEKFSKREDKEILNIFDYFLNENKDEESKIKNNELEFNLIEAKKLLIKNKFDDFRELFSLDKNEFSDVKLRRLKEDIFKKDFSEHVISDLLEGRYDKIRKNLSLDEDIFNDKYMDQIVQDLNIIPGDNLYQRAYMRGWEAFEIEILREINSKYNLNLNEYDLYDLLDGEFSRLESNLQIGIQDMDKYGTLAVISDRRKLERIRKEILGSRRDSYDLMRSKGVQFLIGGNEPMNRLEVYKIFKAYGKFSEIKDETKLLRLIKEECELKGIKSDTITVSNISNFFNEVFAEGLLLPGMELTAEAEMLFAWHMPVTSNYNALYQKGTKMRALNKIVSSFENLIEEKINFKPTEYEKMDLFVEKIKSKIEKERKKIISGTKIEKLEKKLNLMKKYKAEYDEVQKKLFDLEDSIKYDLNGLNKVSLEMKNEFEFFSEVEELINEVGFSNIFISNSKNLFSNLNREVLSSSLNVKDKKSNIELFEKDVNNLIESEKKLLKKEISSKQKILSSLGESEEEKIITLKEEIENTKTKLTKIKLLSERIGSVVEEIERDLEIIPLSNNLFQELIYLIDSDESENLKLLKLSEVQNNFNESFENEKSSAENKLNKLKSDLKKLTAKKGAGLKRFSNRINRIEKEISHFEILLSDLNVLKTGSKKEIDFVKSKFRRINNNSSDQKILSNKLNALSKKYKEGSIPLIENEIEMEISNFEPDNVFVQDVLHFEDLFRRYEFAQDFIPRYNTLGITGKSINAQIDDDYVKFGDGSYRRMISACDNITPFRKFSQTLENEVNKYFVTFPFIGLMSEGVSTFNTIYRSKDYISTSLRHYHSYDSTNLSDLKRNEDLADLITELYKKKWSFVNRCKSGKGDDLNFDVKEEKKQLLSKIQNTKVLLEKKLRHHFSLRSNVNLKEAIEYKKSHLDKVMNEAPSDKEYILAQKELEHLNEMEKEHKEEILSLEEVEENIDSNLSLIVKGKSENTKESSEEIVKGFDNIINELSPFVGEYLVKEKIEDDLMKNKYYIQFEKQKIENYMLELSFYNSGVQKIIKEIEKSEYFKELNYDTIDEETLIKHLRNELGSLKDKIKFGKKDVVDLDKKEFIFEKLNMLEVIKSNKEMLSKEKTKSKEKIIFLSNLKKNRTDWKKIKRNHKEKAKTISKDDIAFDKLFRTSTVLFEHFNNSYESIYKTRNLSIHTRRAAYGLPANEFGGTQFAGPISSTPLQYYGTLGITGNQGWFIASTFSFAMRKVDKIYYKRFAMNYMLSDVPLIYLPMGTRSRMNIKKYFEIKEGVFKKKFGEYLNAQPHETPPSDFSLITSLFSKNVRGEQRISEFLDLMGGSYRGTAKGARDVYNWLAYRPNVLSMDFKDKIYTYQKSRSMKKSAEHLYDVGIYAPYTNNQFIAGREITLFNDIYYNQTSPSTFYPNRASNLLSSAPHYSHAKYRNMAYNGIYKYTQTQLDLVMESTHYSDLGKKPYWQQLSIPFLPLVLASGFSFLSVAGFLASTGVTGSLVNQGARGLYNIKSLFNKKEKDYYANKYMFYQNKGMYSGIYEDYSNREEM